MNNKKMYSIYMIAQEYGRWGLSTMGFVQEVPTKEEGEQISFYQNTEHARLYVLDQETGESILICEK